MIRRSLLVGVIILVGSLAIPAGTYASEEGSQRRMKRSSDGLTRALRSGEIDKATYALERAESLFTPGSVRSRFGTVRRPDPHSATLLLRDLAAGLHRLEGSEKRRAQRILARPTDGADDPQNDGYRPGANVERTCRDADGAPGKDVCLHWDTATSDAVQQIDSMPANGVPDYIDQAHHETEKVWKREVNQLGYREPKADGNSAEPGPNALLDLYFVDIGDDGLYGYCTTDEPDAGSKKTVSAYCVLDNDYDPAQYNAPPPEVSGIDALRVTLAHEFFHAIQFNYDWREAPFLMEGTAVWMEDQVYDDINASYAYLFDSILHQPEIPLDGYARGDDGENFEYGAFIFFTWLAEDYGNGFPVSDPSVVRDVWKKAGARKEGIGAVQTVVSRRGHWGPSTPFRDFFAGWGAASYYYDSYYEEGWDGVACDGPTGSYFDALRCTWPPFDAHYFLPTNPSTGWQGLPIDRLSTRYVKIWTGTGEKLKVEIDLPKETRGGEATVVIQAADFTKTYYRIKLNDQGNGSSLFTRPGDDEEVILALTNTGSHNNERYKYKVSAP